MAATNHNSEEKLFFWGSTAELKIFNHLNDLIDTKHYIIFPHLSIAEAFNDFFKFEELSNIYDTFCDHKRKLLTDDTITQLKARVLELSHFDFVIFDKGNYLPILIIEVNGYSHATNTYTKISDAFKEYLCREVLGRPLLKIELFDFKENLKEELINTINASNFNSKYNYPIYCKCCGRKMTYRDKNDGSYFYYCQPCQEAKGTRTTQGPEVINPIFINF